ncbi:MAG: carboxypeptidase-like regulatory domain-containing protein [Rhodanobacter sp.]
MKNTSAVPMRMKADERPGRASPAAWRLVRGMAIAAVLSLGLCGGCAMGASSRLVLFSEVHGTVLRNGVPIAGAQIRQEVVWSDDKDEIPARETVSDGSGRFSFAAVERRPGALRVVPHQPVILQKLIIRYDGVDYPAWRHTKNSYGENSELDGRPMQLVCELSREPDFEGTHYGICRAS